MKRVLKSVLRLSLGCALAALPLAVGLRSANADTLTIIAPSNVTMTIGVGVFQDDEGNINNPDTGNPYAPGDTNPDDGTPVSFLPFGTSVGQGDPSVPPAVLLPGGIVPVTSDGSNTTLNGTVSVTPGAGTLTINSANVGLNTSGLWQPGYGVADEHGGPPSIAELGLYIDLSGLFGGNLCVGKSVERPLGTEHLGSDSVGRSRQFQRLERHAQLGFGDADGVRGWWYFVVVG